VPTIKVATNTAMAERLGTMIDLDAGTVLSRGESVASAGRRLFELIIAVASGAPTRAELNRQRDFALPPLEATG
jgi:altronate hydrolase